jgi:hypothetical protein
VWVLSTPFAVYGLAFIFAGCAPFASSIPTRGWLQNVASGFYAAAASSGSMFFALNFGDEGKIFSPYCVDEGNTNSQQVEHQSGRGSSGPARSRASSRSTLAGCGTGARSSARTTATAFLSPRPPARSSARCASQWPCC